MNDRLDNRLDKLLASRPVQPSADFSARVLQAVRDEDAAARRRRTLIAFTLPLAAALAVAAAWIALVPDRTATEGKHFAEAAPELQEALILEDGLAGLAGIEETTFEVDGLLATFEALYHESES